MAWHIRIVHSKQKLFSLSWHSQYLNFLSSEIFARHDISIVFVVRLSLKRCYSYCLTSWLLCILHCCCQWYLSHWDRRKSAHIHLLQFPTSHSMVYDYLTTAMCMDIELLGNAPDGSNVLQCHTDLSTCCNSGSDTRDSGCYQMEKLQEYHFLIILSESVNRELT